MRSTRTRPVRSFLTVVAGAAALTVLSAGGAAAAVVVSEGFESATGTFTLYGTTASRDCVTTAAAGTCSMKVDPAGAATAGARYLTDFNLNSRTTVRFSFRGGHTRGTVDANLVVALKGGDHARLHLTDGLAMNNELSLFTNAGSVDSFTAWPDADTWYQLTLVFDTAADTVTATAWDGTTATMPIGGGETAVDEIDAHAIRWGAGSPVWFDAITVETCTFVFGLCV